MYIWRIKSQGNEEARQQFLEGYVPQIWELGLTVPDPNLQRGDDGVWRYSRAGLGGAQVGRHRPRPALAGPARVPRPLPRAGAMGPRRSSRRDDLRGLPPGAEGPAVPACGLGRGARRQRSPRRGRASSTAAAASRQALWLVPRASIHSITDWADEFDLKYRRVDGYSIKERLRSARERASQQLLDLADDELILGWRDSEWTGIAPTLEEDVAFSSIAQNEIGHARALYELAARELDTDADALAFDRKPGRVPMRTARRAAPARVGAHDRASLPLRGSRPHSHRTGACRSDDAELAGLAGEDRP